MLTVVLLIGGNIFITQQCKGSERQAIKSLKVGSMEQQNMLLLHGKGSKYFLYCTFYFRYIVCTIQIWKKSIINCMLEKKMFLLKLSWWSCTIIHNNMIIQHFSLYNRQSSNILSFTDLKTSGYVVKTRQTEFY